MELASPITPDSIVGYMLVSEVSYHAVYCFVKYVLSQKEKDVRTVWPHPQEGQEG